MRGLVLAALLVVSCSPGSASATPGPAAATPERCVPTTARDPSGVITANGTHGLIGTPTTSEATMAADEPLLLVRRGARVGDQVELRFDNVGHSAPATWVSYVSTATPRATTWGRVAFEFGWKPIGFRGSCWRVVVDGADSGLVLQVLP